MKFNSLTKLAATLAVVGALTTGCSYNVSQYGASVENVDAMKNIGATVNVQEFTSSKPGLSSITCRGAGPVGTPDKVPFETYIKDALISELKLAGQYDPKSNITLSGHFEKIDFNSNIGTANWLFTLNMSSSNNHRIVINSKYEFPGSFVADKACQEVAQAFSPAVQNLIKDIVSDPMFKTLL